MDQRNHPPLQIPYSLQPSYFCLTAWDTSEDTRPMGQQDVCHRQCGTRDKEDRLLGQPWGLKEANRAGDGVAVLVHAVTAHKDLWGPVQAAQLSPGSWALSPLPTWLPPLCGSRPHTQARIWFLLFV